MTLSWTIVAAVLFGALLHASWNALVKSSRDKALDTAVIHMVGTFVGLPLVLVAGLPPAAAWPYIGASVVIHIAYYIALTGAYKHGDLGLTYPLMRGVGPMPSIAGGPFSSFACASSTTISGASPASFLRIASSSRRR